MKIKQQDEYFFVCYDEVIKTFKPLILSKLLLPENREKYKNVIDYSRIENKPYIELFKFSVTAGEKDIIKEIQTADINTQDLLNDIMNTYNDIITDSHLLTMGCSIRMLLDQNLVKKVYIYRETIDSRIVSDLSLIYQGDERVKILSGDFDSALALIPERITMYMLNDIKLLNNVIKTDKIKNTSVLVSNVGYNYKVQNDSLILQVDNTDELTKQYSFVLGLFSIESTIKFN